MPFRRKREKEGARWGTEKESKTEQQSSYKARSSQENLSGNFSESGFPLGKATLCQLDLGTYSAFVSQSGQARSKGSCNQIYSKYVATVSSPSEARVEVEPQMG